MSWHWFYLLVTFGFLQQSVRAQTPNNGADVVFVLDSSSRVSLEQWQMMRQWLQQLVAQWQLNENNVQVGFYSYGNGAHRQWALQQVGPDTQVLQNIQSMQRYGGSPDAAQAVHKAYTEGFQSQNGGRAGVPRVIVHVTAGPSSDSARLRQEVQAAKQQGVAVYRVGIGASSVLSSAGLAQEASEPVQRYTFTADNYETLNSLTDTLSTRILHETPSGHGASLPNTSGCLQKADVVFLLDGSSSVGSSNFQRLLNYVKTFSSQLPVSQPGVHVGLVQFSSRPSVEFGLDLYTDRASLLKGIDNVQYLGGGTNTADALQVLRTQMFSQGMGARPGVPRIAVVVTDGRSSSMADTVKAAEAARQQNIGLVVIGVGSDVNTAELQGIAGSAENVLQVKDFDGLPSALGPLLQQACQVQATQAPLSATHGTTPDDPCKDALDTCHMYDADMCTQYGAWARENCAKHCHFCTPLSPQVLPPCQDKLTNCGDYDMSVCADPDYASWARQNCALYCGMCGANTTSNGYYGQCYYKGKTYKAGESWYDGCDFQCTCENGQTGHYTCYNRCPIYEDLPASCTLVETPDKCCLKPVCNFQPTIQTSITTGLGRSPQGMNVCEHRGGQYVQGESWDIGCDLKCTCEDASNGKIRCQDYCPTYSTLPSNCHMQKEPGQCCAEPICEFATQTGSITGSGQTSGHGVDQGGSSASNNGTCMYMGHGYKQGETWDIGCDQQCVCEQADHGYYRCFSRCPQYNNLPAQCQRTPATDGSCCETITCPSTITLMTSVKNVLTPGSGSEILQPDPNSPGHMSPLVPIPSLTGGSSIPQSGHRIEGCLYKGQLYVQDQRWDDGCQQVCECTSASQGLYSCSSRCPAYPNLPAGCALQSDPADACCKSPVCGPQVQQIPIPVYSIGTVSQGEVRPPIPGILRPTSQTVLVTQKFNHNGNPTPTLVTGPAPTGGVGYCEYKNQRYSQSERWTDGCDYNCLCEDASTGYWICSEMCMHYPPLGTFCKLVRDEESPCCMKPYCEIPGVMNATFGEGSTHLPIITTRPPMVFTSTTSPRPAMCVYKDQQYSQGQEWYDGCDYRCHCYDAISNLYSCRDRCPTFFGLDEDRCTLESDPDDPTCCKVPVCRPPTTPAAALSTPIPTAPGGSFEVTNSPGIGYCDYKGHHYHRGDSWKDGCQYSCQCLDNHIGRYRCDESCPRFPNLPAACHLVPDFANPCCQKPVCNFTAHAGSITGHAHLQTTPRVVTPSTHTSVCVYNGVNYNQGQTWEDGCQLRCRCEDADKGLYVCNERCAKYDDLPEICMLVTDPTDQCCLIPQCHLYPTSGYQTGQGQVPNPFPTFPPGQITGEVSVPTPGPGLTPAPLGYCVYKGSRYSQGQMWRDGCDYDCVCEDANTGKYNCNERCSKYPHLPAQCRLFKDPANPCCMKPDCSFPPTAAPHTVSTATPSPGSTLAPPLGPDGSTLMPPVINTPGPKPSKAPVCVYRGQTYAEGQTWYDGCDFVCVCEKGSQGTYRCSDRCPSYPTPAATHCVSKPDPNDPMCCEVPECDTMTPTPIVPNGPYLLPTIAPQGVVTGGSVTPSPRPLINPTPGPDGSTLSPPLGTTPKPKAVCIYKGQDYTQGQKWQDGCDYDCECVDASSGQYRCVEMCPRYPPIPQGCYMVQDVYKPCCETAVCPFPPTLPPVFTGSPTPGVTQAPPTGPDGHTLVPPVISTPGVPSRCVYNGVPYRTGDTWEDGCDLRCRCEDETSNVYRCDQRCARYDPTPGCTMVADPRDSCCLAPFCQPSLPPTLAPNQTPNQPATPTPNLIPTAIPGKVVGNSVNRPNTNNPHNETMCVYDGTVYKQGDHWQDGCDYTCVCTDQTTGRYECSERCPPYLNLPPNCVMAVDPKDACCEKPVCVKPQPNTQAPHPSSTLSPRPGQPVSVPVPGQRTTQGPNPGTTAMPRPENVCTYKNAVYVQGQHWYDGCDKECVCEDGSTGYYRCTDRCKLYDSIPAGCTLVVDPKDPACCKVPQCAPTPGPLGYPTPQPGQSPTPFTVTNIPGVVTGHAPTPTPGTDGKTPQPIKACVYKGRNYARGQRWQDGCDYNCVCENEDTGEYKCTERCSPYPLVPPQCHLTRDPSDFCCQVMTCDPTASTPNPFLTLSPRPSTTSVPDLGPTTLPPTPKPGQTVTPRPIPVLSTTAPDPNHTPQPQPSTPRPQLPQAFCVYQGVPYSQGATWQEGCSKTCRCEDADNNYYTCFDRCPAHNNLDPKCSLTLDPNDPCCQIPVCPVIPTPSPNLTPGRTPGPGQPTSPPTPTPYAVPQKVPAGSIVGNRPNTNPNSKEGFCVYKGSPYKQGNTWDDGCDFNCTCIDENTGRYVCNQKCDDYTNVPPNCVLVKDPANACCMKPTCANPVTQGPSPRTTLSPPGTHTLVPPNAASTLSPLPGQSTVSPPQVPGQSTQKPSVLIPTPGHPSVCVMNDHSYTQGQQWYDGCSRVCVCEDGATGFYTCRQRCPDYPDSDPTCLVVPDPSDPACCTIPQCTNPNNPDLPTGHKGTITGTAKPPVPLAGTTLAPLPGHTVAPHPGSTQVPQPRDVCLYKGQEYSTGQRWRDGCDYDCVCEDGTTGRYKCTDRCLNYPPLVASGCRMERDPSNPCCQVPICAPTAAPILNPNHTPGPGEPTQSPTANPGQVPNTAVCVYQGVPYRQGQTWKDGCDKVCRCEDGKTGRINCDDRCPSYPNTQAGCRMVTDPQDPCCQMPQCENPNTNIPTKVITGVPGTIEGHSVPPRNPNPLQPRPSVCVYRGVEYQQGQRWDDGCSYTCVCEDGLTGHYKCTERCARVPTLPSTCSKVQDPTDLCCQLVTCPVQHPAVYSTLSPTPYTGPSTLSPHTLVPPNSSVPQPQPGVSTAAPNPFGTPQPTPRSGFCLYKNQYYREQQVWYDGCDAVCTCEDANTGFYRCQERCGDYQHVDNSCILVADPKDPTCCKMPECPLIPPGGTTPSGPAIIRPPLPTASFTNFPTPTPRQPVTQSPPLGPDGHTLVPPVASTQTPTPRTGCVYKGRTYHQNEKWQDGCDYNCVCLNDETGQYKCSDRCARMPSLPKGCVLIEDPKDACCQVPYCDFGPNPFPHGIQTPTPNPQHVPNSMSTTPRYIIPGYVTINGGGKNTTPKPGVTFGGSTDACVYQGVIYRQGDKWEEGCDKTCVCDDAKHGLYTCRDRCPSYGTLSPACVLRANPADPCCLVPDCNPNYVTSGPGSVITGSNPNVTPGLGPGFTGSNVNITPKPGEGITGSNPNITPGQGPGITGSNVNVTPVPGSGITGVNPNITPGQGPGITGSNVNVTPVPGSGITGVNPNITPGQGPGITGSNVNVTPVPGSGITGANPNITPGQGPGITGSNVNVTPVPGSGITGANPNITPGQGPGITGSNINVSYRPGESMTGVNPGLQPHQGPGISGTRAPVIVPTAAPATFTGQRPNVNTNNPGSGTFAGYTDKCVYKGTAYGQGATWEDGCQYRCECTDAVRGSYRCTERCSSLYFLPKGCTMEPDPNDSCCQRARCSPDAFPTPTPSAATGTNQPPHTVQPPLQTTEASTVKVTSKPGPVFQGTRSPVGSTVSSFTGKPPDMCVYTDGRTYHQGDNWTDGCAYTCVCENAASNTYKCDFRCPVYSDLPQFCSLVKDPQDQCCQKVACQTTNGNPLVPVPGDNKPTASPTMPPTVTNIVPIGTHNVTSGSGLVPGENTPGFFGGRHVCVYKGTFHQAGETWDDGCDYTCECLVQEAGVYQCTSKCPKYPPLPQYCSMVNVPGQCCPSLNCNIPNVGPYRPNPQLEPHLMATPMPNGTVPQTNPQLIIAGQQGPLLGGKNPPGGGTVLPDISYLSGVTDRCVYQGIDGKYRVYTQGETWRVNQCDYDCECVDSHSGFYQCQPVCPDYSNGELPDKCTMQQVQGQCCPALRCTNPDGTVVDYTKNPNHTYVPVYGVKNPGYSGFRPGYVPGGAGGFTAQNNACIYKGVPYRQGATWDDGCEYTCRCTDALTGLYSCTKKCEQFTSLPPVCQLVTMPNDCCPKVHCQAPPTLAPTTPPTTTPMPTSGVHTGPCTASDKLDNCRIYDKATACVGVYEPWARENCPVYCGYCQDAHPTTPGPCVDVLDNCAAYGSEACTGKYLAWATDNCRKTCNLCEDAHTTTPGPCVDVLDNCAAYGSEACTGKYLAWATDNCQKTCNLCACVDKLSNCDQYGAFACVGQYESWARDNCPQTCGLCPGQTKTTLPTNPSCSLPSGQTLLMKGVAGAPGDLWQLWSSPNTANVGVTAAQTLDSRFGSHFKSPLVNSLGSCDFDKIKVAIYKDCQEKASITFNARNSGRDDWFSANRVLDSTFVDIKSSRPQHFQLTGDPATGREFYIGGHVNGCVGSAWFFVSTRNTCPYESGLKPGFYYSRGNVAQTLRTGTVDSGDVLAIFGEGGSCSQGATTPHTHIGHTDGCVYKQNLYSQGEWWQDGCQYNCTCEDGKRGFYRCFDLCYTYNNLPPNCPLIKNPGDCCARPSCTMPGHTAGCLYKNNVYQQGQEWNDGCDYKCTCTDGATGRYECTTRCLQFSLPPECHMDPAPAGKCCQIPVCPSYIKIQYPPGYVAE